MTLYIGLPTFLLNLGPTKHRYYVYVAHRQSVTASAVEMRYTSLVSNGAVYKRTSCEQMTQLR